VKAKPQEERKDKHLKHVIINEKKIRKAEKFQLNEVPFPFETR
jgi:U3 small nucleolar RNA-associated protein 14